jgi:hypothetical protein
MFCTGLSRPVFFLGKKGNSVFSIPRGNGNMKPGRPAVPQVSGKLKRLGGEKNVMG